MKDHPSADGECPPTAKLQTITDILTGLSQNRKIIHHEAHEEHEEKYHKKNDNFLFVFFVAIEKVEDGYRLPEAS